MDNTSGNSSQNEAPGFLNMLGRGAAGVGLVLVALPTLLLFFGMNKLADVSLVGLPLLAIFGIMILFGSLALVAMLFQSLGLSNRKQPLALPEGSIRAAIALSLIVLFAIISIMLFQSLPGSPYVIGGLDETQRNDIVGKAGERVVAVASAPCAASAPQGACPKDERRYEVHLRPRAASESTDLAKQLLIMIGTLMTSVTSYYFAARGAITPDKGNTKPTTPQVPGEGNPPPRNTPANGGAATESHLDGCDVPITEATPDEALPAARGGVAEGGR